MDNGEFIAFEYTLNNGSDWTEGDRITGNIDPENRWLSNTIEINNISDALSNDSFGIRFKGLSNRKNEAGYIDNLEIIAFGATGTSLSDDDDQSIESELNQLFGSSSLF